MTLPTPQLRAVAHDIITHALDHRDGPGEVAAAIEHVFEELYALMSPLVGPTGFASVIRRAHHLSRSECRFLDAATIESMPLAKAGIESLIAREGGEPVTGCATLLMAQVLALLCSFIGEELTLRLVRRAWPHLPDPATLRDPKEADHE